MNAFDWLMDFDECLGGEHGAWWQDRAEQHADEFLTGEKPAKWWAWRDVRQRENPPIETPYGPDHSSPVQPEPQETP